MVRTNQLMILILLFGAATFASVPSISSESSSGSVRYVKTYSELRVFKDPLLFLGNIALLTEEPKTAMENLASEDFLLTILPPGEHQLVLFDSQEFKSFVTLASLTRFYQKIEPRLKQSLGRKIMITPMMIASGSYQGSLGFVLSEDLKRSRVQEFLKEGNLLPPSVRLDDQQISEISRQLKRKEPTLPASE